MIADGDQASASERLAGFAAALRWPDVPSAAAGKLEDHLLDTLGVMLAGVGTPEARKVADGLAGWRTGEGASVIGSADRLPPAAAAFLNAFHGRIHTYDDTIEAGPVHPGSSAVAAALAAGETAGATGADVLAAILAGYEVTARVSAALGLGHYARGFHNTGTCNVFGAAAAAARVRGLDASAAAGALSIAGGMAAGLRQYQIDGGISDSALNGAHAAMAGVLAADLAAAGMVGPRGILDGRFGLGSITSPAADFAAALDDLGSSFRFMATALKPYPTCRFTHGPLEAIARLQSAHRFAAGEVRSVEIATFRQSIEVSDRPGVRSRTGALLSHQHAAAVLMLKGGITLDDLDARVFADPEVVGLAARVRVVHDDALEEQYPAAWPHCVTIALANGRRLEAVSHRPPGGPDAPLPRDVIEAKFLANAEAVLGRERAASAMEAVAGLDRAATVEALTRLMSPRTAPAAAALPRRPASTRRGA